MMKFLLGTIPLIIIISLIKYINLSQLKKNIKKENIEINSSTVNRILLIIKQYKKSKPHIIKYTIKNYLIDESDMFIFTILLVTLTAVPLAFLTILKFEFPLSIIFIFVYVFIFLTIMDIVHYAIYRNKRTQVELLLTFLKASSMLEKNGEVSCNSFIGSLFFSENSILIGFDRITKKNATYEWCELINVNVIRCKYEKKSIIAMIETKEKTYERKFPKFMYMSTKVEKDYFNALYEFPFMERSTVYDFERLHHDIMQDLVDEERTFYFKDYLIKEEAS